MTKNDFSHFETKVSTALAVPPAPDLYVDGLWQKIRAVEPTSELSTHTRGKRVRLGWSFAGAVLGILLVVVLAIGPNEVWAQVRGWFAPGVGLVQSPGQVRVLGHPVSQTQDGMTVTVDGVSATSERVWLRLRVEGVEPRVTGFPDAWANMPVLIDDGGAVSDAIGRDVYAGESLFIEYQFEPLADMDAAMVSLALPVLPSAAGADAPQDWQLEIPLRAATAEDLQNQAPARKLVTDAVEGVSLELLQVYQTPKASFLSIRVNTPTLNHGLYRDWWRNVSLKDEQGRIYPMAMEHSLGDGRLFIFKTRPFSADTRLTLTVDELEIDADFPQVMPAPGFDLDLGAQPQEGQTWEVNQVLDVLPYQITVDSVTLNFNDEEHWSLDFTTSGSDGVTSVMLDGGRPIERAGGEGVYGNSGDFFKPRIFFYQPPSGVFPVRLMRFTYLIQGPWELTWQPRSVPETASLPTPNIADAPPLRTSLAEPTAIPITEDQANIALATQVQALLEKNYQAKYGQEGWFYRTHELVQAERNHLYAESYTVYPQPVFTEEWNYVGAGGEVSRYVAVGYDEQGNVSLQIARVNETIVNFTAGTASEEPLLMNPPARDPLPEHILRADEFTEITSEETSFAGRQVLWIRITSRDPQLANIKSWTVPLVESQHDYWIDLETGEYLQQQVELGFQNGENLDFWTNRSSQIERLDTPSQAVQDLLDQVVPAP